MSTWETVKLGQVAQFINGDRGKNYPSDGDFVDEGIAFINAGHLSRGAVDFSNMNYISESRFRVLGSGKTRENDILYCLRGSLGKTAIVRRTDDAAIASSLVIIRATDVCDVRYLYHFLTSPFGRAEMRKFVNGSSQPNLSADSVKNYRVPLPPLSEQRRIAAILDKADELRAKRRAALEQLNGLTQSMFLEMFGEPHANPKAWTVASLASLGRVLTGGTPPSSGEGMFGGSIPFVTPGDLESNEPVKRTVTNAGAIESQEVRAGATLVCCIGATIGKMGKVTERSAFNQQINAVDWGMQVDDEYGLAALRLFKIDIVTRGTSTTLPILKKSSFQGLQIPVPPLALQRRFGERVACVEKTKATLRSSVEMCDALFASIQHQAFAGGL